MRYAIVTTEFLIRKGIVVPQEWRRSLDGLKVIVHEQKILPVITAEDDIVIYEFDSPELKALLDSTDWSEYTKEKS